MALFLNWPEYIAGIVLILGIIIALFLPNPLTIYIVSFLAGFLFGRIWNKTKTSECIPLFFAIMTFYLGFILGGIFADVRLITLIFISALLLSSWMHEKKIIP